MSDIQRKKVVILGAGFGGLWTARALSGANVDVLVLDRNNYHTFLPLLYQVAAAEVGPDEIAAPVRKILNQYPNVDFSMETIRRVDPDNKVVFTDRGPIPYDYLVMALGSAPFYFNTRGAAEYAFALKDMEQALMLRNHILSLFEQAEHEPDPARRREMLTFTIVGGGPTGVEFAGALAELVHGPLRRDHKRIPMEEARIVLLEGQTELLRGFPTKLSQYAHRRLEKMGIEVCVGALVDEVTPRSVHLKDGALIPTQTVIWTAGVRAEPTGQGSGLPTLRNGQVNVTPTLQVEGHPEVYVVGDSSHVQEKNGALPMLAPVAIQEGAWTARNIKRQIAGQAPQPFHYKDRGSMVTIGRNAGVAQLFGKSFTGVWAWLLWVGVHIYNLIGFRNRLAVLLNWGMDYFLYEREVRLILPAQREPMAGAIPFAPSRELLLGVPHPAVPGASDPR